MLRRLSSHVLLPAALLSGCFAADVLDRITVNIAVDGRGYEASCAIVDVINPAANTEASATSALCHVMVEGRRVSCRKIDLPDRMARPSRKEVTAACRGGIIRAITGARDRSRRDRDDGYRPPSY